MSEKEFVFNVFVKKLELRNDLLTSDETIVKFEWGDDKDLNFDIKSNRINISDFDVNTIVEFKRNVDNFVESLQSTPFKLIVFENRKRDEGEGSSSKDDNTAEKENLERVGEAECPWPTKLISSFKTNECAPYPYVETYEIKDGDEKRGLLTVSFLLHFKCEEDNKNIIKGPYVDKEGRLGAFKEIGGCLEPNDIFFVIGNPPCPQKTGTNLLASCGGRGLCPGKFDSSRYKYMQGSLINDCNAIGGCGSPGCCQVKGDMELCREVLEEIEAKTFLSKKRKPKPVCPIDPCERIFGPMSESCDGLTGTDMEVPCNAEFHTLDCASKSKKREKRKKRPCRCRFAEPSAVPCKTSEELIEEALKNNQYDRRRKEILYPHTCPAPELLTSADPLQVRCCPICCEDISWVPPYGPCPKCGFKPTVAQPLEELPYDDEKTAEDILEQLKEDVKKFRREKKISKYGACNCTPYNECLNCQLRKLSRHRAKKRAFEAEAAEEQSDDEDIKQNELRRGSRVRHADEKENKGNNIISDAIAKQSKRRSNYEKSDYKIPNLKRVIKWCKKQSDLKAKGNFSDSDLCTTSSFSSDPSECGGKLKGKKIPECNFSISISGKGSSGASKSKQSTKTDVNQSKRRAQKKAKYFNKDEYPGVILGHKDCVGEHKKVPRYMGWLWSASINGSNRGWRPGAVRRETHKIMKYFLRDRDRQDNIVLEQTYEHQTEDICMPSIANLKMPTIRVTKKKGQYKVTVHPMRDPSQRVDPRDTRSLPIEFTIEKDPIEIMKRQVKSRLKEMGFRTCTCGKPIYECDCRGDLERDQLEDALEDICDQLCVPNIRDKICLSDTTKSESEMDMEFSPPAAKLKRPLPKKPSIVYVQTQCDPEDIKISTARQDVWKIRPKDVLLKPGHGCGGISKPPPCWPPVDLQSPKKISGQEDKLKKTKESQKPKKGKKELEKPTGKTDQPSKMDQSKKTNGPERGKSIDSQKLPKSKKPSDIGGDKSSKPDRPGDANKSDKPPSDLSKIISKPIQPIPDTSKPGENDKKASGPGKPDGTKPKPEASENKSQGPQDNKPKPQASQPRPSQPSKSKKPTPAFEKPEGRPTKKPTQDARPSMKSVKPTPTPSQTGRKPARPSVGPVKPNRPSQSTEPNQPEAGDAPSGQRVSSLIDGKSRRISKPTPTVQKRFSISQIPTMKTTTIKPRKNQPCREASLMGVKFKPLECDKAAVLSCPLPQCEPAPCLVPCYKPHCDNCWR